MQINQYEVQKLLERRGWGLGSAPGVAFTLCRRTGKKRKTDGLLRWEAHGAITVRDLNRIIATSPDPTAVVERVEAVAQKLPDPWQNKIAVETTDPEKVEAMVQERVRQILPDAVAEALKRLGIDEQAMSLVQAAKAVQTVKRRGRPRKNPLPAEAPPA